MRPGTEQLGRLSSRLRRRRCEESEDIHADQELDLVVRRLFDPARNGVAVTLTMGQRFEDQRIERSMDSAARVSLTG